METKGIVGSQGYWGIKIYDAKGALVKEDEWKNLVVNEGLNYLLSSGLAAGTPITSWYVGLMGGTPTVAAADTLASHSGWTEVTAYTQTGRQAWTPGTVASESVDNSASVASFSINANSTTIGGAFLCSAASGTTGTLYAAGAFTGGNNVIGSGSTIQVTATFTQAAV